MEYFFVNRKDSLILHELSSVGSMAPVVYMAWIVILFKVLYFIERANHLE